MPIPPTRIPPNPTESIGRDRSTHRPSTDPSIPVRPHLSRERARPLIPEPHTYAPLCVVGRDGYPRTPPQQASLARVLGRLRKGTAASQPAAAATARLLCWCVHVSEGDRGACCVRMWCRGTKRATGSTDNQSYQNTHTRNSFARFGSDRINRERGRSQCPCVWPPRTHRRARAHACVRGRNVPCIDAID